MESAARGKRTHPIASTASDDSSFLYFLSSPTGDERFFYVFYLRPWATSISFTFFSFARGRRTFSLHFLASPAGEEHSFYILLSSPLDDKRSFFVLLSSSVGDEYFFCFPLIRCFRDVVFSPWSLYRTHIGQSAARTSYHEKHKYGEKTKGNIELRNTEAGVLQVLFGMLHLMGEALLTEISRLQFCKKDKKNCTLHIKVVYLPTV